MSLNIEQCREKENYYRESACFSAIMGTVALIVGISLAGIALSIEAKVRHCWEDWSNKEVGRLTMAEIKELAQKGWAYGGVAIGCGVVALLAFVATARFYSQKTYYTGLLKAHDYHNLHSV